MDEVGYDKEGGKVQLILTGMLSEQGDNYLVVVVKEDGVVGQVEIIFDDESQIGDRLAAIGDVSVDCPASIFLSVLLQIYAR